MEMEIVFLIKIRSNTFVIVDGDLSNITDEDSVVRLPKPIQGLTKQTRSIFTFKDVSDFHV